MLKNWTIVKQKQWRNKIEARCWVNEVMYNHPEWDNMTAQEIADAINRAINRFNTDLEKTDNRFSVRYSAYVTGTHPGMTDIVGLTRENESPILFIRPKIKA